MATERVEQTAFLLHSVPHRETSLIVELFTKDHGRVAAIAKGARRKNSALRAALMPFQPIRVAYSGNNELRMLIAADWAGGYVPPVGDALICGFYMNELLLRLLAREDCHGDLFSAYFEALVALAEGDSADIILRRFEWQLLRETGYAPDLQSSADTTKICDNQWYRWSPTNGFVVCEPDTALAVSGGTLRDIANNQYESAASRQQAKLLTRTILGHHLNGSPIHSRQILIDLQKL